MFPRGLHSPGGGKGLTPLLQMGTPCSSLRAGYESVLPAGVFNFESVWLIPGRSASTRFWDVWEGVSRGGWCWFVDAGEQWPPCEGGHHPIQQALNRTQTEEGGLPRFLTCFSNWTLTFRPQWPETFRLGLNLTTSSPGFPLTDSRWWDFSIPIIKGANFPR